MKKSIVLLLSLLAIGYFSANGKPAQNEENYFSSDSIKIFTTPDLYKLSQIWVNEYTKLNPGEKIRIEATADSRLSKEILKSGNIGLVSKDNFNGFDEESHLQIVVGRDVLVPVISSKNPYFDEISSKGISPEKLGAFLNGTDREEWGALLGGLQKASANYYFIKDLSISNDIQKFLNSDVSKAKGIQVDNSDDMIASIKNDPYAIGFCRLVSIVNIKDQSIAEGIRLLPIDRNNNGVLDYNEKIYEDYSNFSRAIWIGKYPKALISNIYAVSSKQGENKSAVAFMKWILNDGQQFLFTGGYSEILTSERLSSTDKIIESQISTTSITDQRSIFKTALLVLAAILLAGFIIDFALRSIRKGKTTSHKTNPAVQSVLDENSLILPKGLYFDKTHTWAFMEQNGMVKVGIDDFLQHITGTLTRLKMKNSGDRVEKGEVILTLIQNGKQLNVYAPISGIIMETNNILNSDASILNSSPYNDGWVYRIEPSNWSRENQLLFIAEKHRQYIKNEFIRLKEFLASALAPQNEKYAQVILQDGGELVDNTLSGLGPEVWDDFQTKFIDPSRQIWFYELF